MNTRVFFPVRTIAVAVLSGAFAGPVVAGEPVAISDEGCHILADVGVTAAALARNRVPDETANKILLDIYDFSGVPEEARATVLEAIKLTIGAARSTKLSPREFMKTTSETCVKADGDVEKIFGSGV